MKPFNCVKCGLKLGGMIKGSIRHGAVLLCKECWERAELAIQMADLAAEQGKGILKGSGDAAVDRLMGMFGMDKNHPPRVK